VTVIPLLVQEHPVDDVQQLPSRGNSGFVLPPAPLDPRIELREAGCRIVKDMDVDRLREDPSEVRGALLAYAAVLHG